MSKKSIKEAKVVPYQLCPKCNGDGVVMVRDSYGRDITVTIGQQTCDVCNGAKIIPMCVIK
jgi:DnaJ-class molecular chaperone